MIVKARVQVTVELDVRLENWDNLSTVEQVHREGGKHAVEQISKLCQRYVRLIGPPRVELILVEERK